jgi:hypothetical protein
LKNTKSKALTPIGKTYTLAKWPFFIPWQNFRNDSKRLLWIIVIIRTQKIY